MEAGGSNAFSEAVGVLEEDSLDWWKEDGDDAPEGCNDTAEKLLHFLKSKLIPWLENTGKEAEERGAVRVQAQGESLDPHRMGILLGLDERLGRQFEKVLGMLIKLQKMRGTCLNGSE